MKIEKIEELWIEHSIRYFENENFDSDILSIMGYEGFVQAINQAEIGIYLEVIDNLRQVNMQSDVKEYIQEIQNKIKGLENDNN